MAEIITMPKLGFDMKEGTLVRWVKSEGEQVTKGDILAEIETDKATVEVESSHNGVLYKQLVEIDAIVPIGDPIAVIAAKDEDVDIESLIGKDQQKPVKAESSSKEEEPEQELIVKNTSSKETDRIFASPIAKRMAEENDLDLSTINGSGPGGRIIKKDVESAIENKLTPMVSQKSETEKVVKEEQVRDEGNPLPKAVWNVNETSRKDHRQPLNKLRQAISRRMVDSKQNIPHFYVTKSVKADKLMDIYKEINATLPNNQKISINDFVVKATAIALREYPNLNASISDNDLIQHGNVNIGIAVAVEGGLLTVVVRDADIKPIRVISQEVKEMASRVREGKVRSEDIEGSTFSISNLGMFEVDNFSAIINPPEVGILAVSSALKEPVVENDEVRIAWRMKITLSADHRATDGVEAAKFSNAIVYALENPMRLLL